MLPIALLNLWKNRPAPTDQKPSPPPQQAKPALWEHLFGAALGQNFRLEPSHERLYRSFIICQVNYDGIIIKPVRLFG